MCPGQRSDHDAQPRRPTDVIRVALVGGRREDHVSRSRLELVQAGVEARSIEHAVCVRLELQESPLMLYRESNRATGGEYEMLAMFTYLDADGKYFHGLMEATLHEMLSLFDRFSGLSAAIYLPIDESRMIACVRHGSEMFEVQVMDERKGWRRIGQVPTRFAKKCVERIFGRDYDLEDLEAHSTFYYASAWDASNDRNYRLARDMSHWIAPGD